MKCKLYRVSLVRQTGLEPVRRRHTPLKRACLPIPALPQSTCLLYHLNILLSIGKMHFKKYLKFILQIINKIRDSKTTVPHLLLILNFYKM